LVKTISFVPDTIRIFFFGGLEDKVVVRHDEAAGARINDTLVGGKKVLGDAHVLWNATEDDGTKSQLCKSGVFSRS
jgi:hypothetical protein